MEINRVTTPGPLIAPGCGKSPVFSRVVVIVVAAATLLSDTDLASPLSAKLPLSQLGQNYWCMSFYRRIGGGGYARRVYSGHIQPPAIFREGTKDRAYDLIGRLSSLSSDHLELIRHWNFKAYAPSLLIKREFLTYLESCLAPRDVFSDKTKLRRWWSLKRGTTILEYY